MSVQVKRRRGTTAQHSTFTGAVGEITVDTDKDTAVVHDGATAGGFPLAKASDLLGPLDNVSRLGVNATSDATNKLSVKSSAVLFDNIGAGMQGKINKNAAGDTASLLYQTGFSGRAEIGAIGDDSFHFKVSPDGSTWKDALTLDKTLGDASFIGAILPKAAGTQNIGANGLGFNTAVVNNILFPATQVPSANVNNLDDYEEGTWTPALKFGGAAVGMTYTTQTGRYTKIGNVVIGTFTIVLSALGTSTGAATVTGMPFTNGDQLSGVTASYWASMALLTFPPQGYATVAAATINLQQGGTAGVANLTDTNFTNTSRLDMKFAYRV